MEMGGFQRRLRWSNILLGVMILFWLPVEDQTFTAAILFSAAVCFLGALVFIKKRQVTPQKYAWLGLLIGASVGPVGFLLMVFKIGLHNHATPDFTFTQLLDLLKLMPAWGFAGFLLGLGLQLYVFSRSQ
jgi:hypothetical protein